MMLRYPVAIVFLFTLSATVSGQDAQYTDGHACKPEGTATVAVTMRATPLTAGTVIRWYKGRWDGPLLHEGESFTVTISSTELYFATDYRPGYGEDALRTPVFANVLETPATSPTVTGNVVIGPNQPITLVAHGANPYYTTGYTYEWLDASNTIVRKLPEYPTIAPAQTTADFVRVRITGGAGCEGPATPVTVTVHPSPVIQGSSIMPGQPVTLSCNAEYDSYAWFNTANPSVILKSSTTQSDNTFSVSPGQQSYQVRVTKGNLTATSEPYQVGAQVERQDINYVVSNTIQIPGITDPNDVASLDRNMKIQSVAYFDELGRPMQTVTTQGSPKGFDIVQPIVYDKFGREDRKYLPMVMSTTDGWYKPNIIDGSGNYTGVAATNIYNNGEADKIADDAKPYALTLFEPSPLERVAQQGMAGAAWQPDPLSTYANPVASDHSIKRSYESNVDNEVLLWTYTPSTTHPLGLVSTGTGSTPAYYAPNQLSRNRTKDEHQNEVIEYVDKDGRTVLKRVQAVAGSHSLTDANSDKNYASTYYIYDDFGNLVCVIPPEATSRLATEYYHAEATDDTKDAFLARWAFRYTYDTRQRMTQKQMPGIAPVWMTYDFRDRLVMTQDGNQRKKRLWLFTKYDEQDRVIMTGLIKWKSGQTREAVQYEILDSYDGSPYATFGENYVGDAPGNVHGYTNTIFPLTDTLQNYLTVTYYDNYDFVSESEFEYKANVLDPIVVNGYTYGQGMPLTTVKGQVTGGKVKNLADGTWLKTATYYDNKYRIIQTTSAHQRGGFDRTTSLYDFTGKVLATKTTYTETVSPSLSHTVSRRFGYDHAGRLINMWHKLDSGPEIMLARNEYNEVGQLVTKSLHKIGEEGLPVTADPAVGQPGVAYDQEIISSSYNSAQHTYIASQRIILKPGFTVPAGNQFNARIGFSQQHADAYNAYISTRGIFLQNIDYRYNIRGWLTNINDPSMTQPDDLFNMELRYNNPTGNGGSVQYNGNISEAIWNSAGLDKQSYGYNYDVLNRLTEANYFNITTPTENERYNEKVGNLTLSTPRPAYDLNGNILNLFRSGKTGENSFGPMDDLAYAYTNGNQLSAVTDAIATQVGENGFKDVAGSGVDYGYDDDNGNMTSDANKDISLIEYNHLNLPSKVVKNNGEYILYTYDATGRKLRQAVYNASGVEQKVTDYVGEFYFENGALQFINNEEGRVVMTGTRPEYQYHLKDHLDNVRLTFTTKLEVDSGTGTLEAASLTDEQATFLRYNEAVRINAAIFDHTNGASAGYSQRLNGTGNERYGIARSISVMPGDTVKAEVFVKYADPNSANWNAALTNLMTAIVDNSTGIRLEGTNYANSTSSFNAANLVNTSGSTGTGPKAYLNWIIFDRDYSFKDAGYVRVTEDARETGNDGAHERLFSGNIVINEPGYVYLYLSNENETPVEVFFDDFKVDHVHGRVVQMDDYYPFGLTFNSYQRENSVENSFKYNGKELQDGLSLEWYDYIARQYNPAIGRFLSVDPAADLMRRFSPYAYAFDNPVRFTDPDGMVPSGCCGLRGEWEDKIVKAFKSAVENGSKAVVDGAKYLGEKISEVVKKVEDVIPREMSTPKPKDGENIVVVDKSAAEPGPNNQHLPPPGENTTTVDNDVIQAVASFVKTGPPGSRSSNPAPTSKGEQPTPVAQPGEVASGVAGSGTSAYQAGKNIKAGDTLRHAAGARPQINGWTESIDETSTVVHQLYK